jgi:hypothetical protein
MEYELKDRWHTPEVLDFLCTESSVNQHQARLAGLNQETVGNTDDTVSQNAPVPFECLCKSKAKGGAVWVANPENNHQHSSSQ